MDNAVEVKREAPPPAAVKPATAAVAREIEIQLYARREEIYPRQKIGDSLGTFQKWRWAAVWLTQIVFYGLPWLQWNGRQALLFDLAARKFYIFGMVLWPQDIIYLTAILIIAALSLFLFTAVGGRLWCGYACPQTVYTEIFMWIERHIEGDRAKRMRLDQEPLSARKFALKAAKHGAWIAVALWTGFTFVGYFTPIRAFALELVTFTVGGWSLFWILFYGFATYGNAGFMREQVCKYMCPYARFQGAMFDHDTLIISYDPKRGEPRGSRSRNADKAALGLGDCVDCTLCVQVCPTGIDIRKGLQNECIGCAACIDVCNGVMDKLGYPRGLIRYATQRGMDAGIDKLPWARVLRPRVLIYSAVLLLIGGAFVASLALRSPLRVDVVRDRGALARIVDDGYVENVYRLQVMNTTERTQTYRVGVTGIPGVQASTRGETVLAPAESRWIPVAVQVGPQEARALGPGAHKIEFRITREAAGEQPEVSVDEASTFIVLAPR